MDKKIRIVKTDSFKSKILQSSIKMVHSLQAYIHNDDGVIPLELFSVEELHQIAAQLKQTLNNSDRLPQYYWYDVVVNDTANTITITLQYETRDRRVVRQPIPNYKMNQVRSGVMYPLEFGDYRYKIELVAYER